MKRALFLSLCFCLCLMVLPARAQTGSLLDWVPADMQAVVSVDMSNPADTLDEINRGLLLTTLLQPRRTQVTQGVDYNALFSLNIFDLETTSFADQILPWLGDSLVLAYRQLDANFTASAENSLMILSTDDPFGAAAELRRVLTGQDLLEQRTVRGQTVYLGDRTAFAFTPAAILIGPEALVVAALDAQAGETPQLVNTAAYQSVAGALPARGSLFAFFSGDAASRAPGVFLSNGDAGTPILAAITESVAELREGSTPEAALLSGALDGIGVTVQYDLAGNVTADVVAALIEPAADDATFDPALLDWVPRSAMIVQGGGNAGRAAYGTLAALPLVSFAGEALAAFPVQTPAPAESIPVPTGEQAQTAIEGFLATVQEISGVDLAGSVLEQLNGSYTVAVLPRPNNPTPGLETPFDLLILARTENSITADLAAESLGDLLRLYGDSVTTETLDEGTFSALRDPDTDEAILRIGSVDDLLVLATGDALDLALRARVGDNQLIDTERWQGFVRPLAFEQGGEGLPYLYVDLNAAYNTFLPVAGGPAQRPLRQLAVSSRLLNEQLVHLRLVIGLG
jgi:hypothetical protein